MASDGGNKKGDEDIVVVTRERIIVLRGSTANAPGCSSSEGRGSGGVAIVCELESRAMLTDGDSLVEDE